MASLAVAQSAGAASMLDASGAPIPNTSDAGPQAQLASGPTMVQMLAEPFAAARPADVGPTGAPDDDLAAALARMADAADATTAADARQEALDILEGNPLPGRVYSGLPLLNWDLPGRVRDVPAGGEVTIREVRFGEHALTDTAMLRFADPSLPFTIRWRISELGTSAGGELAPAPLLRDGATRLGGQPSVLAGLGLDPMGIGTTTTSRFHPDGQPERTGLGVRDVVVRMPPAGMVEAILDPDLRPDHRTLVTLRPATADRLAALSARFGFSGSAPTPAEKAAAIAAIGATAPEKQLWSDLTALDPADVTASHALGADDAALVDAMRTRTDLPAGVGSDPAADVSVALVNGEAYVSRTSLRVAPGAPLRVQVVNRDGFPHDLQAIALHSRQTVFGPLDWGRFADDPLDTGAGGALAPNASRTITLQPQADAFAVWIGDPDGGDQAGAVIDLYRGPARQSLSLAGPADDPRPFAAPLHSAEDGDGNRWLALSGVDEIVRIAPGDDLQSAARLTVKLPAGAAAATPAGVLGPHAVAVDAHGIVWSTLTLGGAIARIDPALVHDGTSDGVTLFPLAQCDASCRMPPPPDPQVPLRLPVQMALGETGAGDTTIWFAEEGADRIGLLRVDAQGKLLDRTDFPCGCRVPQGIDLGPDGAVWFTEAVENRIGRLTPDVTRPFASSTLSISHFKIPSSVSVIDAKLGDAPVPTSAPHSLSVDRLGRVWFSEEATGKLGLLDPAAAHPGTTDGMREIALERNEFGGPPLPADIAVDRAGTVFWGDEYGDVVGSATTAGPGPTWRPAERQSLTDAPEPDSNGDLWFSETGATLLTRIRGVTAGLPRPGALPLLTADLGSGALTARGLREIDSVDVAVRRAGAVVTRADGVGVDAAGGLRLGAGGRAWDAAGSPALRAGDRITVTPHARYAPAPFTFALADLSAAVADDGTVSGHALVGAAPAFDAVTVQMGPDSGEAPIDVGDGSFSVRLAAGSGPGTVSWTSATPMAKVRVVADVAAPPRAGTPAPSTPAAHEPPAPAGSAPGAPAGAAGRPATPDDCPTGWLTRAGGSVRPLLLGALAADARRCLGAPARVRRIAGGERWTFSRRLELTLAHGRVTAFALLDPTWRSAPGGAGVGSRRAELAAALGRLERGPHGRGLRAVLRMNGSRVADVRIALRGGRASRIDVLLVAVPRLDAQGRRMARRAR